MDSQHNTFLYNQLASVPPANNYIPHHHHPQQCHHQYQAILHPEPSIFMTVPSFPSTSANVLYTPPPPSLPLGHVFYPKNRQFILNEEMEREPMHRNFILDVSLYKQHPQSIAGISRSHEQHNHSLYQENPQSIAGIPRSHEQHNRRGGFVNEGAVSRTQDDSTLMPPSSNSPPEEIQWPREEDSKAFWQELLHNHLGGDESPFVNEGAVSRTQDDSTLMPSSSYSSREEEIQRPRKEESEAFWQELLQDPIEHDLQDPIENDFTLMSYSSNAFTGEFCPSLSSQNWEAYPHGLQECTVPSYSNASPEEIQREEDYEAYVQELLKDWKSPQMESKGNKTRKRSRNN